VFGAVHAALTTAAVHHGLGKHFPYLTPSEQHPTVYFGILSLAWGNLSPMAGRISFCITMLYLAKTDPRVVRWPIWTFIGGQFLFNMAAVIFFYSQCGTNLKALLESDHELIQRDCLDTRYQTDFQYFVGSFNCVTDLYLTILPGMLINHTRLTLKKKIGLGFLLCLSVLALAAAIVKTFEARALSERTDYTCKFGGSSFSEHSTD
jgi:hypothetical protein